MRKTALYIAMSHDVYIVDRHGGVDWLCGSGEGEGSSHESFAAEADTVIMGRELPTSR